MKLTDRDWKPFDAFGENGLFDIHTTSSSIDKNKLVSGGDTVVPYVTRSGGSNGISDFVSDDNYEYGSDSGGSITVGLDTQTAFYQPYKFVTGQNIHVITGDSITPLVAQFLLPLFRNQMTAKFNWGGNGATLSRMKRLRIMLPVNDQGQPDYQFMADYERELTQQKSKKYLNYAKNQLTKLGSAKPLKPFDELKWKSVCVNDIGDVLSGRDIYAHQRIDGQLPYVTSGSTNNGIGYFVGNDNKSKDCGVISVNRNGAVGEAFYHPYTALFGNDCRKLRLGLNDKYKYAPFFVAAMVSKQKTAFSYSRKLGTARLKQLKIMLPVDDQSQPDYDYMEQYVKNKMIQKYNNYLQYLNTI